MMTNKKIAFARGLLIDDLSSLIDHLHERHSLTGIEGEMDVKDVEEWLDGIKDKLVCLDRDIEGSPWADMWKDECQE